MNLLDIKTSALIVIDMQEAFRNVIPDFATVAFRIATAVRGFQMLGVPVIVTEQYPKGLGPTAEEIALSFQDGTTPVEKTVFSACGARAVLQKLPKKTIRQVAICGIEAHICVNQTAHGLLENGYDVHLLTDCVASRFEYNKLAGIEKMFRSGVVPSSVEMALFELMRDSKHEKFKEIQELIK